MSKFQDFLSPLLALSLLLSITGCATLSGRPEPAATVTDQKPGVEAAYKVLKSSVDQKVVPGMKIRRYQEYGCRASQPVNLETSWRLEAYIPGGASSGKKLVSIYQKAGWKLDKNVNWKDGTKPRPGGNPSLLFNMGFKIESTYLAMKIDKSSPQTVYLRASTPCVVQPLGRSPETDPADPDYVTPTPSPSDSSLGK